MKIVLVVVLGGKLFEYDDENEDESGPAPLTPAVFIRGGALNWHLNRFHKNALLMWSLERERSVFTPHCLRRMYDCYSNLNLGNPHKSICDLWGASDQVRN